MTQTQQKQTGFTPGHWKIDKTFKANMENGIVISGNNADGDLFVCEIANEEDAKLIIAVSDLLEAAKEAESEMKIMIPSLHPQNRTLLKLQKAIVQAEGR